MPPGSATTHANPQVRAPFARVARRSPPAHAATSSRARDLRCPAVSPASLVEVLQQLVRRAFDVLVPPLGRPVQAGDHPAAVEPPEVAVDERVPRLGPVPGTLGQPEM